MRQRIVDVLAPALQAPGSVYVDATLGLGGHAAAVLVACPQARLIGIDRDPDAHALASERLRAEAQRCTFVVSANDQLAECLDELGITAVNAVLLDLGLSSLQIDRTERGFAYRVDAPLDMRMNQQEGESAAELLNRESVDEIARILTSYGEERFARRIARAIVAARPISTTGQLVEILTSAIPAASQRTGGHPAKRTFQALRIAVNDELAILQRTLEAAIDALAVGGRIAVLSYHSLEDRIVKQTFGKLSRDSAPRGLPMVPQHLQPQLRLITTGAERPTAEEIATNPRSASARLRVATRIREAA